MAAELSKRMLIITIFVGSRTGRKQIEFRNGEEEKNILVNLNLSGRLDFWKAIIFNTVKCNVSLATVTVKGFFSILKKI